MSDAQVPISSFSNVPSAETQSPDASSAQAAPSYQASPDSIAEGFLKNVDPRDRPVLERYVRDWDRGVNQRFREIHQQYEPYKNLGASVEDIQTALQIAQLIDSDPRYVWDAIGQEFNFINGNGQQGLGNGGPLSAPVAGSASGPVGQNGQGGQGNLAEQYGGLPEPFVTEFTQMRQVLLALGQKFMEQEKSTKQQQEDKQLDAYMADLHQRHGDFDDDWVMAKMWSGQDGEKAVQAYKAFIQNVLNSHSSISRPVPPILGGAGGVPGGPRAEDLSRQQAKALMADMLSKTAQQAQ